MICKFNSFDNSLISSTAVLLMDFAPCEPPIIQSVILFFNPKLNNPVDLKILSEQEQMLLMIDALCFAQDDISLYLTLYPNDRDMLELFNQYQKQEKAICNQYEAMYGPLSLSSNALNKYPWSFNNEPWPWEK